MNDLSETLNFSVRDTMSNATHSHIMHSDMLTSDIQKIKTEPENSYSLPPIITLPPHTTTTHGEYLFLPTMNNRSSRSSSKFKCATY
ncbi:hypothetical protein QE152_g23348 [Popillia japonica]|uniref:Uncharacterized protein n=1 Tax=Popillia japonica TaxID=7064 RepID=A0AAW1KIM8_POPJA